MKNDHWKKWQKSAGRYFSSFSWLHEEMTYCQKNPITLILKSNICFIKPNPYLADFLRYSKSSSHCEKLYFISNMCSAHAFVDKTTNWVSGFEFQQNLLTTNMKFQFIELNPDLKSWQQWIGINNLKENFCWSKREKREWPCREAMWMCILNGHIPPFTLRL